MKLFILILFSIVVNQVYSQNFVYQYTNGHIKKSDDYILTNVENISYFTTVNSLFNRKYIKKATKIGKLDMNSMKNDNASNYYTEKFNGEAFIYNYLFGARVLVSIKQSDLDWKILNETKQVEDKLLRKATLKYGGRNWEAWYDLSIPISDGPYVFSGLPGLVVEIFDEDKIHHFLLKGNSPDHVEKQFLKIEGSNRYTRTTQQTFLKLVQKAKQNPKEFSKLYAQFSTNIRMTPERKKAYNQNQRNKLKFMTIERLEQ